MVTVVAPLTMSVLDDKMEAVTELGDDATEDRAGGYGPFAYLATPNAQLYRRVMKALMAEKERFTVHVRPDDIAMALAADGGERVTDDEVGEALARLAQPSWGNVLTFADSSRVTALADFYRRRMLYQLSREGEAAERALAQYDAALGSRGALQSVALEDIVVLLTALRDTVRRHADGVEVDTAVTHQNQLSLRARFVELAENAVAFMGSVQRAIDLHDADVDAFLAYKEQLIEYLERFIGDLLTRGAAITALLTEIPLDGVVFLVDTAARRESLDAAPGEADAAFKQARDRWVRQWSGLTDWFISTRERESEARLLRSRARAAIPALLAVVRTLNEHASGRTDRTNDFLTLARWFAALPSDGDRHRLWRSAFGLSPVRHLSVTSATESAWDDADLGSTTSWADAPALEISPQLRRSGSYERRGRASRVTDRSAAKKMLADQARAQAEQTAQARRRILTNGPQPLSAFGELDTDAFGLFLGLLGDGLAAMGPRADTAQIATSDGELTVTLHRIEGTREMTISTPDGDLTGPDHLVDIAPAAGVRI
ncbi:TIGR02677 family protein [Gordonia sp. HY002]|uniref:TIGR02677 family protein n=1 Tax=Gordonia zhenghanii TaxID=2911516 RepID=UPI001EEFA462|nr:TIGR02677 family protein [Gordonia zhenghanii]MCF8571236.1 TIGR02677 family protein [Gordonia zhenghanii]MCF8601760.1 TIGR02677 family protein [Gordonia zhenghanii]